MNAGGWMDSLKFFKVVCISTLSLAFLLLASIPAFAQAGSTGRIIGSITDSTGAVIGGATVSVTDTQRGTTRTLTTDEVGAYNAPELIPGMYVVKAEFPGFNTVQIPKAEYGWKPGAIVNVGLRSGNNTVHGTAYAFGRSDAL